MDEHKSSTSSSLNPFAVVICEDQRQKTSVRTKTSNPKWSDTLVFKSVRAVSVLEVKVYSKARRFRREDRSLGWCYIRLDTVMEKEVTRFKLERQGPKDIISGSIDVRDACSLLSLSFELTWAAVDKDCGLHEMRVIIHYFIVDSLFFYHQILIEWNRTPLEQLALLLRNRETELRVKEQLLTLLEARISDSEEVKGGGIEGSRGTISEDGRTSELPGLSPEHSRHTPSKAAQMSSAATSSSHEVSGDDGSIYGYIYKAHLMMTVPLSFFSLLSSVSLLLAHCSIRLAKAQLKPLRKLFLTRRKPTCCWSESWKPETFTMLSKEEITSAPSTPGIKTRSRFTRLPESRSRARVTTCPSAPSWFRALSTLSGIRRLSLEM